MPSSKKPNHSNKLIALKKKSLNYENHITITPLTSEKFFTTCITILNEEVLQHHDKVRKTLEEILIKMIKFSKHKSISPLEWQAFDFSIMQSIAVLKKLDEECGNRLTLIIAPGLERLKNFRKF